MDAKIVLYPRQTEAQRSTARALLLAGEGGGRSYALRAILPILCGVNPGTIPKIHDEVREVAPGLFLGPAMWKGADKKTLVLWFALDSRLS